MCQKTDQDFWEATYREIDTALTAAMRFEQEHTLPLLAIQATWAAVQLARAYGGEKMLDIDKLMGKDADKASGQMSKAAMMSELTKLSTVQTKWKEEKKKKEADLESA